MRGRGVRTRALIVALWCSGVAPAGAQEARAQASAAPAAGGAAVPRAVNAPPEYLIGPDDQLTISFWREKELSADVIVRPDGRISLPLLNDVQAAGLTPEQLRRTIESAAQRFVQDPSATVMVRQINSRRVFIVGAVAKPGPYPLTSPTTVLQLIAMAGGLLEHADADAIAVMRAESGRSVALRFNYRQVIKRTNLRQNIELKPGDTVVVP